VQTQRSFLASLWTGLLLRIAKHWIAGETPRDAFDRVQQSNSNGVQGIINFFGEEIQSREEVAWVTSEYLSVIQDISELRIEASVSVKPTQLGLSIDPLLFKENLGSILSKAESSGIFVWVDMESSALTTEIINTYIQLHKNVKKFGVAIQAYLRRSEEDLDRILDDGGVIRLCKGAYDERVEIAFKHKAEINENYLKLMRIMFERGRGFAIATHDEKLIEEASRLSNVHHADFEFNMLMGIRDEKKLELVRRGYRVSEYVPFGKDWWDYSVRRIREHKSNIFLLARSLVSG
jgi:proline dehydrogenase